MPYVTTLTESDLDFGLRITKQLQTANFPFSGSFWLFDDNASDWQLIVATELVDKIGPRGTYLQLGEAISNVGGTDFQRLRLTVMSPQEPLYQALRKVFGTTKSVEGARLQNTTLSGNVVPDAYLYRIR